VTTFVNDIEVDVSVLDEQSKRLYVQIPRRMLILQKHLKITFGYSNAIYFDSSDRKLALAFERLCIYNNKGNRV